MAVRPSTKAVGEEREKQATTRTTRTTVVVIIIVVGVVGGGGVGAAAVCSFGRVVVVRHGERCVCSKRASVHRHCCASLLVCRRVVAMASFSGCCCRLRDDGVV